MFGSRKMANRKEAHFFLGGSPLWMDEIHFAPLTKNQAKTTVSFSWFQSGGARFADFATLPSTVSKTDPHPAELKTGAFRPRLAGEEELRESALLGRLIGFRFERVT